MIRGWVDLSALGIAKEVIQGIEGPLSVIGAVLANISPMADRVVDGTISTGLLRSVVGRMGRVGRVVTVARCRAGMHLGSMMVIVTSGTCKMLQVSNYCFLRQTRDGGETPIGIALRTFAALAVSRTLASVVLFRRAQEHRVVGVSL